MKYLTALSLTPLLANAGVMYDLSVQPLDRSDLAHASASVPVAAPAVSHFFVDGGRVRVSGAATRNVYLFEDRTMYVIDDARRSVHVLKHATLDQVAAHYAGAVQQLQDAAVHAPPDQQPEAQRKAADMKAAADRALQPVPRTYRVTVRFESVDGRPCRIWEERENDEKRLELCVAGAAAVPGGVEILAGLKTLSRFREGAEFALGLDFGLSDWWPDFSAIGGIPLLIREYKYELQVAEVTLTAIRAGAPAGTQLAIPDGYRSEDGPDYAPNYLQGFLR